MLTALDPLLAGFPCDSTSSAPSAFAAGQGTTYSLVLTFELVVAVTSATAFVRKSAVAFLHASTLWAHSHYAYSAQATN